jgi:hypothetical protein
VTAAVGDENRQEFLRRFDDLIEFAATKPFYGHSRVTRALRQVRRQKTLMGYRPNPEERRAHRRLRK